MLGYRNKLLYFFIQKYIDDPLNEGEAIFIDASQIRSINVKSDKKIICLQEIGAGNFGIVVEDLVSREASFMSLKMISETKKQEETTAKRPGSNRKPTKDLAEIVEVDSQNGKEEEKDEDGGEEGGP